MMKFDDLQYSHKIKDLLASVAKCMGLKEGEVKLFQKVEVKEQT